MTRKDNTLVSLAFAVAVGMGLMLGMIVGVMNGPRLVQNACPCPAPAFTVAEFRAPFKGTRWDI